MKFKTTIFASVLVMALSGFASAQVNFAPVTRSPVNFSPPARFQTNFTPPGRSQVNPTRAQFTTVQFSRTQFQFRTFQRPQQTNYQFSNVNRSGGSASVSGRNAAR